MTVDEDLRDTLATALRDGAFAGTPQALAAAEYHGIIPLLFARTGDAALKAPAQARAMWELRHRQILSGLLAALDADGVRAVVIKGTALAYDLYNDASLRPRGDTDLLVAPKDLNAARATLAAQGFTAALGEQATEAATQEVWQLTPPGGGTHDIDLHWQAINGPTLAPLIPVPEAMAEAMPLPRLSPHARGLSRGHGLIHSCVHRAQHILSPYFVAGEAHYGGDRLIWLCDIDRLARSLTAQEWEDVTSRTADRGIAPVCHGALLEAIKHLETPVPEQVLSRLASAPGGAVTQYLLGGSRTGRALSDLRASGGTGRLHYLRNRLFPKAALVRGQYPQSTMPLPILYLRRIGRFVTGGRQ